MDVQNGLTVIDRMDGGSSGIRLTGNAGYVRLDGFAFVRCLERPAAEAVVYNLRGVLADIATFYKTLVAIAPEAETLIGYGERQLPIAVEDRVPLDLSQALVADQHGEQPFDLDGDRGLGKVLKPEGHPRPPFPRWAVTGCVSRTPRHPPDVSAPEIVSEPRPLV